MLITAFLAKINNLLKISCSIFEEMTHPKLTRKHRLPYFVLISLLISATNTPAQTINGTVTDTSGKPLAFAAIKLADTKQGIIADLNGKFKFTYNKNISYITVSHVSFTAKKIEITDPAQPLDIQLEPLPNTLGTVIIPSRSYKLRRILNTALANRSLNNPEKYDWYQCNVYYKTTMDIIPSFTPEKDSVSKEDTAGLRASKEVGIKDTIQSKDSSRLNNDTSHINSNKDTSHINKDSADIKKNNTYRTFLENQHAFITETFSRRTWQKPQKLQEEVKASRMSGFRKSMFTALVTNVLPFHTYDDYIQLNGKDFRSPVSSGMFNHFRYKIEEEILQGKDTLWVISFEPKKDIEQLSGTLYIHSYRFAIAHIIAVQKDTTLKREMNIEQQYRVVDGKWFPQQLNYNLIWKNVMNTRVGLRMNGRSVVDSVSFARDQRFRFDKAHTIKLTPGADEQTDSAWKNIRPVPLAKKEQRTYTYLDSLGKKYKIDRLSRYADRLTDGFFPIGSFDVDLKRIYSYNLYEKHRFGFGVQTTNKLSKHFVVGAWFGYGTGDKAWKYGGYSELYLTREKDFTFKISYDKDLKDPGRLQVHKELNKNFIRSFLLSRADEIENYSVSLKKRTGYWENTLTYTDEKIQPKYAYAFDDKGRLLNNFHTRELTLGFRYAFAERMAPLFGRYYSLGSKYPIVYGKITAGEIINNNTKYIQAVAAISWKKHISRLGNEKLLVFAGKNFSKNPLPLSRLFAGSGFLADNKSVNTFGGLQTMLPYGYYSNEFVSFHWNHEFDFKLFNKKISKKFSTSPTIGAGYNMLVGTLHDTAVHKLVNFSVPNKSYHEAGLLLSRLIRMKFIGLYYVNFNAGYFYHFDGPFDHKQNGKFVFGLSSDL